MQDQLLASAIPGESRQPKANRYPARLSITRLQMLGILLLAGLIAPVAASERSGKPMEFDPAQSPEVVVILPREGIEETKAGAPDNLVFNANINYGRAFSRMGDGRLDSRDIDGYGVRWLGKDQLEVAKLKGTTTKTGVISYSVAARVEETSTAYKLHMALKDKRQETPFDLARTLYTVKSFEPDEARAQLLQPIVHFQMEIDSQYGPDSLRGNFERLGEPARWNRIMAGRFGLRQEAKFYSLPSTIRGVSILYVLDVFPYRNGAKAKIMGEIVGAPTSENTVDMTEILRATQKQLRSIALD